ncbi:MAG: hypothetical protein CVV39_08820 [Planctomycetes bacterium HGW-Planctomycetes-1]|nr:MAG: hypothetical protein CVV39_08820 [Planctomycetes bacterium HGW-Planctomycetes-1]
MFEKTKKALLVVFITCLIWVWADLSLDKDLADQTVTITVSRANPRLWVTIEGKTEIQIKADLKGSARQIGELISRMEAGKEKLEFAFDAEKQNMAAEGEYTLPDVRRFLAESDKVHEYGLAVKAARPDRLQKIRVVELKEKTLPIKCVDESDTEIPGAKITPNIIAMLAPEQITEARVKLVSVAERKQARGGAIDKKPYIELARGEVRYSDTAVRVELPLTGEDMKQYTLRGTLGFVFSANLIGKYEVEFIKRPEIGSISILATPEAKEAYEQKQFEVLLTLQDDDVGKPEVTRQIIYNFPAQYVREDKIRLRGEPAEATFKLVPATMTDPNQPLLAE